MLYNQFIICMMICSFFGAYHMLINGNTEYLILPIGIIIWGCYKFFNDNDRDYLISHGIDPDSVNAFFPDYIVPEEHHRVYRSNNNDGYPTWGGNKYNTPYVHKRNTFGLGNLINSEYKPIVKKCKRNFKITIEKDGKDNISK